MTTKRIWANASALAEMVADKAPTTTWRERANDTSDSNQEQHDFQDQKEALYLCEFRERSRGCSLKIPTKFMRNHAYDVRNVSKVSASPS
jgi:hypothetical protein